MKLIIALLFLTFFLPAADYANDGIEQQIKAKKGDLREVEQELSRKKREAQKKWWEEKRITDALDRIERDLERKKFQLQMLDTEAKALEGQVARQQLQIEQLERRLSALRGEFQLRVRAMYKLHRVGMIRFLFSAEDYGDALRRYKAFQLVVGDDLRLLDQYRRGIAEEKTRKEALISQQAELVKKRGQVEAKRREILADMEKKGRLLAAIRDERAATERAIAELKEREKSLRTLIRQLTTKAALLRATGFNGMKGKLPPPAEGVIFSPKGREKGVGIEAPEGTPVRAIYHGEVAYAGWFKGYGNLLIIDHGEGYHSVLAHTSRLLKGVGDRVQMGETVALVGSTGSIEGPMLYFELRYHGTPLDPLAWLDIPQKVGSRR